MGTLCISCWYHQLVSSSQKPPPSQVTPRYPRCQLKALEIPNSERKFFMLCCVDLHYGSEKLDSLWALVKDPFIRELFFHYLLGVDSSSLKEGRAPFTTFKQQIQSAQAPNANKWIKHLPTDTDAMCTCPVYISTVVSSM